MTTPSGLPRASSQPGGAIIEAKLHPPAPAPEFIVRPRLLKQLDAAVERPVTLVAAPTGYGKSTLLTDWYARADAGVRPAWLSLDGTDNDVTMFWTAIISALRQFDPPRFNPILASQRVRTDPIEDSVSTELLDALWTLDQPTALVVDDFHDVRADSPAGFSIRVVTLLDVVDQADMIWLPPQQLASQLAGCGLVSIENHPQKAEFLGRP
jgi:hypothetical protein